MSKPLSPKMITNLKLLFQAEPGITYGDQDVARAGIIDAWMIPTNTAVALIDRDFATPSRAVPGETYTRVLRQITAAGCEAIGRSMDEIVAWAWDQAVAEYAARETAPAEALLDEVEQRHPEVAQAPKFPKGTPEYDAYAAELTAELAKFANGESPYEYPTQCVAHPPRWPNYIDNPDPATLKPRIVRDSVRGWNAYQEGPHGWLGQFDTVHEALDALFEVTVVPARDTKTDPSPIYAPTLEHARAFEAWTRSVLDKREALAKAWRIMSDATIGNDLPAYVIVAVSGAANNAERAAEEWQPTVQRAAARTAEMESKLDERAAVA